MRAISSAYYNTDINNLTNIVLAGNELISSGIYDPAIAIVARLYLRISNNINHISDFDFYINELQSLSNIFYNAKLR